MAETTRCLWIIWALKYLREAFSRKEEPEREPWEQGCRFVGLGCALTFPHLHILFILVVEVQIMASILK